MDKTFICMESEGELFFVNLYQIIRADVVSDDEIVLHMSDGKACHMRGEEAKNKLLSLLWENAMNLDGEPMTEVAARFATSESKLRLIKGEEKNSGESET